MFLKTTMTAILTAATFFALAPAARAQVPVPPPPPDNQQWKLGVEIILLPGGDRGCQILRVFDGSPAQLFGLQRGDVLLTVNGELATDAMQVRDTVFASDAVRLVIQRGSTFVQIDVDFSSQGQGNGGAGNGTIVSQMGTKLIKGVKMRQIPRPTLPPPKRPVIKR